MYTDYRPYEAESLKSDLRPKAPAMDAAPGKQKQLAVASRQIWSHPDTPTNPARPAFAAAQSLAELTSSLKGSWAPKPQKDIKATERISQRWNHNLTNSHM